MSTGSMVGVFIRNWLSGGSVYYESEASNSSKHSHHLGKPRESEREKLVTKKLSDLTSRENPSLLKREEEKHPS